MAIGAPLGEEFQGTVVKGIVSANRIQDGFALVQTDMAINHGASGGPVLDDKGYVVGLTESGGEVPLLAQGWRSQVVGRVIDDLLSGRLTISIANPLADEPLSFEPRAEGPQAAN